MWIWFSITTSNIALWCLWVKQSLKDIWVKDVTIASEYLEIVEAIAKPDLWALLEQISAFKGSFTSISFEVEKLIANLRFEVEKFTSNWIARDIVKNVLRNGRFSSYLSLRGPAWFPDRIQRGTQPKTTFDTYLECCPFCSLLSLVF